MVYPRLILLVLILLGFLVIGAPLQWLSMRFGCLPQTLIPRLFGRAACAVLGLRVRRHGLPACGSPQLIVANHVSWTDVLVLQSQYPCRFLAKREVAGWPVFGWFARLQGSIFVDRTRHRAIPAVNAAMAGAMLGGAPVVLFGEGTTSDGTRVKRFYSSHFASARDVLEMAPTLAHVTLQPVAIAYVRRDGLPLGRLGRSTVAWYGEMTFVPHIWFMLKQGLIDCDLVFGPPLAYQRGDDRKIIARQTRAAVHRLVSVALAGRTDIGSNKVYPPLACSLEAQKSLQRTPAEAHGTGQA